MTRRIIFKISDEQIKQMYLNGYSLNDIAKVAQDTKGLMALRQKLIDLGVDTSKNMKRYSSKISKSSRLYTLDETVFDNIDSQEKAYWIGWYMTDGHNDETRNAISLRLQRKDIEILEKLKEFLHATYPIYHLRKDTSVELRIVSKHLSKKLAELGIIKNKTHHKSIPTLDESLIQHFLRGYFDGDGCLSVTERKDRTTNSVNIQLTFTGNIELLVWIKDYLEKLLNLNSRKIHLCRNKSYTLRYSGRRVCSAILNYLYKDATVYLKRKYNKFQNIVSRQSNLQK